MTQNSDEIWLPVRGIPGYEVSNYDSVRSWVTNSKLGRRAKQPRLRKPVIIKRGYATILFSMNGKYKLRYVHHLVLEAFVGERPSPEYETRHLDGNPTNNRLNNLRWGTHDENFLDQVKHGTDTRGDRNGGAKLTKEQALYIKNSKESLRVISKQFNVSFATISRIRHGKRYASQTIL